MWRRTLKPSAAEVSINGDVSNLARATDILNEFFGYLVATKEYIEIEFLKIIYEVASSSWKRELDRLWLASSVSSVLKRERGSIGGR